MDVLITEDELKTEFKEALNRIKKEGKHSGEFSRSNIDPVTLPLNSDGEILTLSCINANQFLSGESKLKISYTIPNKFINMNSESAHSYAKEVYNSESLDMIHSVVNDMFDVKNFNLLISEASSKTYTFTDSIRIEDPTIVPLSEDYEIVPILKLNIEKDYIYKRKDDCSIRKSSDENVDMIIKPNTDNKSVAFDETVNIFGSELTVEHEDRGNLSTAISLNKNDEVYGYVTSLDGAWTHLINANGDIE